MTELLITSSILILAIVLLRLVLRGRISLRIQYALWALVALRLLLPVSLFASPISVMNLFQRAAPTGVYHAVPQPGGAVLLPAAQNVLVNTPGTPGGGALPIAQILALLWLAGACAVGICLIVSNLRFARMLKRWAEPLELEGCPLPVFRMEGLPSPCLFGLFRPGIYLTPESLEDEMRLRHVLTHELTHYAHRDQLWSFVRGVCLVLYWWNLLVWLAATLSKQDCELACDEGALKKLGEENRAEYGRTLLGMMTVRRSPADLLCGATTMVSGKRGFQERIKLIAKKPRMLGITLLAVVLAVALIAVCTLTGADEDPVQPVLASDDTYYEIQRLEYGKPVAKRELTEASEWEVAEQIIMDAMLKSSGVDGASPETMEECYLLRRKYLQTGQTNDYYAYVLGDGGSVLQQGKDGWCTTLDNRLYRQLEPTLSGELAALEQAVSREILAHNRQLFVRRDFRTEAHASLGSVREGQTVSFYGLAYYGEYNERNGEITLEEAGLLPVALTFREENGEYRLTEYWEPEDGSGYVASIKEKFPEDLYKYALETDRYQARLENRCLERAELYFNGN